MKEYKFLIKYLNDETGEIVERTDYDYSLEKMTEHYLWTGLNVISINQL
jgi:hypothetical protein